MNQTDEKRRQLAQENLEILMQNGGNDVKQQLQQQLEQIQSQKLINLQIYSEFKNIRHQNILSKLAPTSFAISFDNNQIFIGTKDGSLLSFHLSDLKQTHKIDHVPKKPENIQADSRIHFKDGIQDGHRSCIVDVCCNQNVLISSSLDNTVNIRNIGDMRSNAIFFHENITAAACNNQNMIVAVGNNLHVCDIEGKVTTNTLIGHVDKITSIYMIPNTNQMLTTSMDQSLRLFDFQQQSQLIYVMDSALECCCYLNSEWFVCGGEFLYLVNRKKRNFVQKIKINENKTENEKRVDQSESKNNVDQQEQNQNKSNYTYCQQLVTSLSSLPSYDLVAVAAYSKIIFYKFNTDKLEKQREIQLENGFVNQIQLRVINDKLFVFYILGSERKFDRLEKISTNIKLWGLIEMGDAPKKGRFTK